MWKMLDDLAVTDSAAYAEMAKAGAEALVRTVSSILPTAPFQVLAIIKASSCLSFSCDVDDFERMFPHMNTFLPIVAFHVCQCIS